MARQHDGLVRQREQPVADAAHLLLEVATGQVGAPDRALEQRVPAEQHPLGVVRDAAGRVAGRLHHLQLQSGDLHQLTIAHEAIRVRRPLRDIEAHAQRCALPSVAQQFQVRIVQ